VPPSTDTGTNSLTSGAQSTRQSAGGRGSSTANAPCVHLQQQDSGSRSSTAGHGAGQRERSPTTSTAGGTRIARKSPIVGGHGVASAAYARAVPTASTLSSTPPTVTSAPPNSSAAASSRDTGHHATGVGGATPRLGRVDEDDDNDDNGSGGSGGSGSDHHDDDNDRASIRSDSDKTELSDDPWQDDDVISDYDSQDALTPYFAVKYPKSWRRRYKDWLRASYFETHNFVPPPLKKPAAWRRGRYPALPIITSRHVPQWNTHYSSPAQIPSNLRAPEYLSRNYGPLFDGNSMTERQRYDIAVKNFNLQKQREHPKILPPPRLFTPRYNIGPTSTYRRDRQPQPVTPITTRYTMMSGQQQTSSSSSAIMQQQQGSPAVLPLRNRQSQQSAPSSSPVIQQQQAAAAPSPAVGLTASDLAAILQQNQQAMTSIADKVTAPATMIAQQPGQQQQVEVTSVPSLDWSGLPTLNLDMKETIVPWFVSFEALMRANTVSERQQRTHLANLPNSVSGCISAITPLLLTTTTYLELRNEIATQFGYLDNVLALFIAFKEASASIRSTAQWNAVTKIYYTYLQFIMDVQGEIVDRRLNINFAQTYIMGFKPILRERMFQKLKDKRNHPDVVKIICNMAPAWDSKGYEDVELLPITAAATVYRNSNHQRSGKRGNNSQRQRPRISSTNRAPLNTAVIRGTKRVDKPQQQQKGPCRNCGATKRCPRANCPARGKTCSKCGKKNHLSNWCRSSNALQPSTDNNNNNQTPNESIPFRTRSGAFGDMR